MNIVTDNLVVKYLVSQINLFGEYMQIKRGFCVACNMNVLVVVGNKAIHR